MKKNVKVFVLALVSMVGLGMAQDFEISSKCHGQGINVNAARITQKQLLKQITLENANMALMRANQGNLIGTITNIDDCLEILRKIKVLGVPYDKRAMEVAIDNLHTARALSNAGLNRNIVRIRSLITLAKGATIGI